MLSVSADLLDRILTYIAGGHWHAPSRLVCQQWAQCLSGPPPPTYLPLAWAILTRDAPLIEWLREDCGIPWSVRALAEAVRTGRFECLEWFVAHEPDLWFTVSEHGRWQLSCDAIQGRHGLLQCAQRSYAGLGPSHYLVWNASSLEHLVQYHGQRRGHEFEPLWRAACSLCTGLTSDDGNRLVLTTVRCASIENVQIVLNDIPPSTNIGPDDRVQWELLMVYACHRPNDVSTFTLAANRGCLGWPLPWHALETACRCGNVPIVRAFLQHPRCSVFRNGSAAAACWRAMLLSPRGLRASRVFAIAHALYKARVAFPRDAVCIAIERHPFAVLRWLVQHGAADGLPGEELIATAISAGRTDALFLIVRIGDGAFVKDPQYTTTAAATGSIHLMQTLRCAGFVWNHGAFWTAMASWSRYMHGMTVVTPRTIVCPLPIGSSPMVVRFCPGKTRWTNRRR